MIWREADPLIILAYFFCSLLLFTLVVGLACYCCRAAPAPAPARGASSRQPRVQPSAAASAGPGYSRHYCGTVTVRAVPASRAPDPAYRVMYSAAPAGGPYSERREMFIAEAYPLARPVRIPQPRPSDTLDIFDAPPPSYEQVMHEMRSPLRPQPPPH